MGICAFRYGVYRYGVIPFSKDLTSEMIRTLPILITAALLLGSAYEATSQPQEQPLEVQHTIPSDDSFIGQVRDVKVRKGEVFVSDMRRNRVAIYSRDGALLNSAGGQRGQGPGEVDLTGAISVKGDSVFVTNIGNRRIDVFSDDGSFLSTFARPTFSWRNAVYSGEGKMVAFVPLRSQPNRLISEFGSDGELVRRFGDMYYAEDKVHSSVSAGHVHPVDGGYVFVPSALDEVRVFEDTTLSHTFSIYNEQLEDALENNKQTEQFPPDARVLPFESYIQASAVHDGIVYAAFREPEQIRILAYTIEGELYGNYVYEDLLFPNEAKIWDGLDVDDAGIYLGLDDDIPKVLVFAHPDVQ